MPSSVTDRTTPAHEMVYLLTKSARYFYDAEAIREDARREWRGGADAVLSVAGIEGRKGHSTVTGGDPSAGRNKRSVWTIPTAPYPEAHFATFPPKLIEPMILAGTSEKGCCPECGAPWERETTTGYDVTDRTPAPNKGRLGAMGEKAANMTRDGFVPNREKRTVTTGWRPTCKHDADPEPVPCTVLDPFGGSGTTGMVAQALSRKAVLIDLSTDYLAQQIKRNAQSPLGM
jgi:hypothetical protein